MRKEDLLDRTGVVEILQRRNEVLGRWLVRHDVNAEMKLVS